MSTVPQPGGAAPDFTLPSTSGEVRASSLWNQGKLVLTFYTEAGTPACSTQVQTLAEDLPMLEEMGAQVLAISSDPPDVNQTFAEKLGGTPFPLASDTDLSVARQYGVADEETKRSRRAIFVIDQGGAIIHANPWFSASSPEQRMAVVEALAGEG